MTRSGHVPGGGHGQDVLRVGLGDVLRAGLGDVLRAGLGDLLVVNHGDLIRVNYCGVLGAVLDLLTRADVLADVQVLGTATL